jgi:hypothetical protein
LFADFAALLLDIFNSILIMYAMNEFYENQKKCVQNALHGVLE